MLPRSCAAHSENQWCQRAIVRATARDAGAKEIAVGQQVRGHERTIAVTAYADTIRISHAHLDRFIDRARNQTKISARPFRRS